MRLPRTTPTTRCSSRFSLTAARIRQRHALTCEVHFRFDVPALSLFNPLKMLVDVTIGDLNTATFHLLSHELASNQGIETAFQNDGALSAQVFDRQPVPDGRVQFD